MKKLTLIVMIAGGLFVSAMVVGCGSTPQVNKEASTSAVRAAEEAGASKVPTASLYLQLAKEEIEHATAFAASGDKEQAESMLVRAQVDGDLAVALSHSDADKTEAAKAVERVQQLRQDNQLPQGRK